MMMSNVSGSEAAAVRNKAKSLTSQAKRIAAWLRVNFWGL
jgi:hypothetical protein